MSSKGAKHGGPRIWVTGYEARIIAEELSTALRDPSRHHNERRLKVVKLVENLKTRMEAASVEAGTIRKAEAQA